LINTFYKNLLSSEENKIYETQTFSYPDGCRIAGWLLNGFQATGNVQR
jgi:CRISPR/Cas system CMR-associated protein Cmr3 (group 5 of RAMP superfamily)